MNVLIFFALFFVCVVINASRISNADEWKLFQNLYGKRYSNAESLSRKKIFLENKAKVMKHNELYAKGEVTYKKDLYKFSDLNYSEAKRMMTGYKSGNITRANKNAKIITFTRKNISLPDSIDWRTKGAVTPVKNQKFCGSCWAFSATGSLEGQYFRKTGKLVSFSEQDFVDCANARYDCHGCRGGWMHGAFQYVMENKDTDKEATYPYEAKNGKCRYKPENPHITIKGYEYVPSGNENALKQAVATIGPISVAIAATRNFLYYKSGVFTDPTCTGTSVNHAVLVVGYGTTSGGIDYWLVKNSWGEKWGEKGYIKMARNKNNMCGIASHAVYPKM